MKLILIIFMIFCIMPIAVFSDDIVDKKSSDAYKQLMIIFPKLNKEEQKKAYENYKKLYLEKELENIEINENKDPIAGMEFVYVKGGCFQMGDTFGDGYSDEKPVHEVCVDSFYIGKYEVSQGQWKKVMDNNPSEFKSCGDDCPVERVSWNDVQDFINELKSRTGKNYRLPTEAEWEYACRSGGKKEKYCGGNNPDDVAWYSDNSGSRTHPVGQKQPNGLGIYDMSGNVWEWCSDWYDSSYYRSSPKSNPAGPSRGSGRVIRGGSWSSWAGGFVRASYRVSDVMGDRSYDIGFRLIVDDN